MIVRGRFGMYVQRVCQVFLLSDEKMRSFICTNIGSGKLFKNHKLFA